MTKPCALCSEPAVTARVEKDGTETPLCVDHLPPEAHELYEKLRQAGWKAPPPKRVQ